MLRCQNVSIKTWIRGTRFSLKNPSPASDINKMKTEFPYFYTK